MLHSTRMKSIGFRCWKDRFSFVVLSGTCDAPVVLGNDHRIAPVGQSRAANLAWMRAEVIDVLLAHSPDTGFYKADEGMKRDICRGEFEGVMQEAAFSHQPQLEIVKRIKTQIRRDIAYDGQARYIDRALGPAGLQDLAKPKYVDATLAALCGLQ